MSCNKHHLETEREIFLENLRDLVKYVLPDEWKDDEDIVESYFQSFLLACEEYKNLK